MAVVVQKLLLDGGHLHEPEPVLVDLLQGIRTRNEQVNKHLNAQVICAYRGIEGTLKLLG